MQWIVSHWPLLATVLLVLSEAAAVIVQLAFPDNKGAAGVIAGLIKFFQMIGAKDPSQPTQIK